MTKHIKIDSVYQYNQLRGVETKNPLVTVIDVAQAQQLSPGIYEFNLYSIYLKELNCNALNYGRSEYDYQEGVMVALRPGQTIHIREEYIVPNPKGYALLFHPKLLFETPLENSINGYSFFSYEVSEALHVSKPEQQIIAGCFIKVIHELHHAIDKHTKKLLTANIELLLNYCSRYYERQFISRDHMHSEIAEKFTHLLNQYFGSEQPISKGLPTVAYCAAKLHFSANYFGDLIKQETGKSAQEIIHGKIIELAKARLMNPENSVGKVAYSLGFKYPQHFTRLFKERTSMTPLEFKGT